MIKAYELKHHQGQAYIDPVLVCSNADSLGISVALEFQRLQALAGEKLVMGWVDERGLNDLTEVVLAL